MEKHDIQMTWEIKRVYEENYCVYGAKKVWRQLFREGVGWTGTTIDDCWSGWAISRPLKLKRRIMLPLEISNWQPEFPDLKLSKKLGAVQ
ncbi:hypothetical protein [Yersinia sp. 1652 StPb PI]|uniref:hypothetical protein n=1 Tax=Yersinia sp. 1652 StPb PI TaxID=3061649 RepID=UPI00355AE92E